MRRRNARGVHVGGTSAGAASCSEHMIAFGDEGALRDRRQRARSRRASA